MAYATVAQLRSYLPQVPKYGQQRITPTAASFVLAYDGTSASSLAQTTTATAVQAALRAISAIGTNVKVTGAPGGPWVAEFQGDLANNAALLTASGATIEPATDVLLEDCVNRATDTIRQAMRRALADPTFDFTNWQPESTRVVRSYGGWYLGLPPHQPGSVSLIEYESGSNPASYASLADEWLTEDSALYRAGGWGSQRYRVTAVWGYGPDVPQAIEQITLELAVNIWRSRDKGGFTELVGAEGGGAVRVVAGLTKQHEATIRNVAEQLMGVAI